MKAIPLLGSNTNFYNQKKESNVQFRPRIVNGQQIMLNDGKTPAMEKFGTSNVTGYYKGDIDPGDQFYFNQSEIHTVTNVVLRRNHAGEFINPEDKKGGFFEVECEFLKF